MRQALLCRPRAEASLSRPQTIRRANRPSRYTTIGNAIFDDKRLSAAALGVLVYFLHLPPDWEIHVGQVQARFGFGRDKMQAIMRELRAAGYARLERKVGEAGQFAGSIWLIDEEPSQDCRADSGAVTGADARTVERGGSAPPEIEDHREPENPVVGGFHREPDFPAAGKSGSPIRQNTKLEQNIVFPLPPKAREAKDGLGEEVEAARPGSTYEDWLRFKDRWRFSLGESENTARQEFLRLGPAERKAAILGAESFQAAMAGRRHPPHAATFLRERKWTYAGLSVARSAPGSAPSPARFWTERGSPQWQAWQDHYRINGGARMRVDAAGVKHVLAFERDGLFGRFETSEWPPGRASGAHATAAIQSQAATAA